MDRVEYSPIVIRDIINLYKSDELDLEPWYQRRPVWTPPQKAYLINTLFVNMPIPSIYIRHYLDLDAEKSIKEVVDGQQRLHSIIDYHNNEFRARHPDHKSPVYFRDLTKSQKTNFLMQSLSVGYLIGADDADVIEIFGRLNWISKKLNDQEKRNAKFGGEFKQFAIKNGSRRVNFWRDYGVFSPNDIARMKEVEFVSDLAINILDGLSDFSQKGLNSYYEKYDLEFPKYDYVTKEMNRIFDYLGGLEPDVIKATQVSRPPIFFSLFIALSAKKKLPAKRKLTQAIGKIDGIILADKEGERLPEEERKFAEACKSSTQRIKSRRVRDKFIKKLI